MKLDGIRKTLHQVDKIRYRPALLQKIARGYFRTLVLRRPTLRIVEFSINSACQSKCEYCYAAKFRRPGEPLLDVAEVRDIWQQASRMGAFCSLILGGEPTLHPKFLDLVAALEPRRNMVSFSTNCISLTEEMVVELKRLGVFVIYVSMNSTDPAINDLVRGYDGHHAHVLRVLEICKRHGIDVVLPITTSKDLLPETIRLVDFARDNGMTASMGLLSPTGRAEGERAALFDADFWETLRGLYDRNPGLRGDWDTNLTLEVGCPARLREGPREPVRTRDGLRDPADVVRQPARATAGRDRRGDARLQALRQALRALHRRTRQGVHRGLHRSRSRPRLDAVPDREQSLRGEGLRGLRLKARFVRSGAAARAGAGRASDRVRSLPIRAQPPSCPG